MTAVYAVSLATGFAVLLWLLIGGRQPVPVLHRRAVSALMAFGLAGLSASYAGLNDAVAAVLAVGAAVGMVAYSEYSSADADR